MSTIKSSREIDRVFKTARKSAGRLVIVLASVTPPERDPMGRVAVVAGKRLGNAVTRNRSKRVLRAALKEVAQDWSGYDIVVVARPTTAGAKPKEVAVEMERILSRLVNP